MVDGWVVGWWGLQSHFHVQTNYSVKVVLRSFVVGVVIKINDLGPFKGTWVGYDL